MQIQKNLKSKIIFLGKKKAREKLEREFEKSPPSLYGKAVEVSSHESYLGDEIGFGVAESVTLTIKKRTGLVKKSIVEIKKVVKDFRTDKIRKH